MRPGLRQGASFIGLVFLVWTVDLADFRPSLQDFLCLIFSCINIVYISFYRMHVLIQFLVIHDRMIAAAKKTYLKDKAEGSWMRKGKVRSRYVAQKRRK